MGGGGGGGGRGGLGVFWGCLSTGRSFGVVQSWGKVGRGGGGFGGVLGLCAVGTAFLRCVMFVSEREAQV